MTKLLFKGTRPRVGVAGTSVVAILLAACSTLALGGVTSDGITMAASAAASAPGEPAIVVPGEPLTGRIYVLADGTITTVMPPFGYATPVEAAQRPAGATQAVTATMDVYPARLAVVDANDRIIQIWSNARASDFGFFAFSVRTAEKGKEHPLTSAIAEQYDQLRGLIDWGKAGRVW